MKERGMEGHESTNGGKRENEALIDLGCWEKEKLENKITLRYIEKCLLHQVDER